jgi:hypothetical protein
MASIHREAVLDVGAEVAWAALRDVGNAHELFAPVLTSSREDNGVRTVVFANGMQAHERILDVSDDLRRVAYNAIDGPGLTYHHASMQIEIAGPGRCRFVWITDVLPSEAAAAIAPLVDQGTAALKHNLEAKAIAPRASEAQPATARARS